MARYLANPGDLQLFRTAIYSLNQAIGPHGNTETRKVFIKAAQFLFIDKYPLKTIYRAIEMLGRANFAEADEIKRELGWKMFEMDNSVFAAANRALPKGRSSRSNRIDARCHAMCLEMRKTSKHRQIRFFSSPAVVDTFFYNSTVPGNQPPIVRDPACLGIERLVVEEHDGNYDKALEFIDSWLEKLNRLLNLAQDCSPHDSINIKGAARKFFGKYLFERVNAEHPECTSYAIYDTLSDGDYSRIWRDQGLLGTWINDMDKLMKDLDSLDSDQSQFEETKRQKLEEINFIITFFYDYLFNEQKLREEFDRLTSDLEKIERKITEQDDHGANLHSILRRYLLDNAYRWENEDDPDGLMLLAKRMVRDKEDKLELSKSSDYFLKQALSEKKISFLWKAEEFGTRHPFMP